MTGVSYLLVTDIVIVEQVPENFEDFNEGKDEFRYNLRIVSKEIGVAYPKNYLSVCHKPESASFNYSLKMHDLWLPL